MPGAPTRIKTRGNTEQQRVLVRPPAFQAGSRVEAPGESVSYRTVSTTTLHYFAVSFHTKSNHYAQHTRLAFLLLRSTWESHSSRQHAAQHCAPSRLAGMSR
ncbi:hypothetical protein E2C01_082331 [Portunus trituberculatus]|uniref:Uncharacterized protein n=1 Tax=Portunus trituberculatus TaxID=210409 RepID=A0A5B7IYT2_PORTR|nr:hypothetical protein [Portunus trituberculatus]